ncbi:hypothetical protein D3C85_1932170 [compost metagenome]
MEVAIRVKQDRRFAFVLNYTDKPVKARLLKELEDLLEGERVGAGELEIAPYGVKVFVV